MEQVANQFDWVVFYKELAENLLSYKNNRKELIPKVKQIFIDAGINEMPNLERDNDLVDIDPFTIFGLFNKSSMTNINRVNIITAVKNIFGITASIPSSFAGVPTLNNQNAVYYRFVGERNENDIEDIWNFFESALNYASSPSPEKQAILSDFFGVVIQKKGIANSKITMGLFWIAPDAFLNLDQRNTWYIYKSGKLPSSLVETLPTIETKISPTTYFDIVGKLRNYIQSDACAQNNFMEFSSEAWRYSEEVNEEARKSREAQETQQNNHEDNATGLGDEEIETTRYWLYSPGKDAEIWDECYEKGIMAIAWDEIGDLNQYQTRAEMVQAMKEYINPDKSYKIDTLATWQFAHEIKPNDVIFAKKGRSTIIGYGIVQSDYEFDDSREGYKNFRKVNWKYNGEKHYSGLLAMKTLTDITDYTEYVRQMKALFVDDEIDNVEIEDNVEMQEKSYPPYSKELFLEDVYMDEKDYDTLARLVSKKKNVILQGAPGVGKTFIARRLAYSIMKVKDLDRIMMIQFHQNYSYEDFIMGFRPTKAGFELKHGPFYNFCKKAKDDSENDYFFIIDEINRANLSKVFGELFMLIENDKRGSKFKLKLLYNDEDFYVPENVYIIGMMNTADRSLAMLDYALRRRFAFFDMKPGFDTGGFQKYCEALNSHKFNNLIQYVKELNLDIAKDESLGEGFCLGHSFFCNLNGVDDQVLSDIVKYELIPLLSEYWFDEPKKVNEWSENLRAAIE